MPLAGKTIIPREIAHQARTYWANYELTKAVATALGESAGSLGAWHDNLAELSSLDKGDVVLNPELYIHMTVLDPATGKVRLEDGTVEMHPPNSEVVTSRDCGLYQINIPAAKVGTAAEWELRTESLDPADYEPVMANNLARARALYDSPWQRDGKMDIRRWQPWVAYTKGYATFTEFWVWKQDADHNPTGPWVKTGRYIQRAISGQMNYHLLIKKDWNTDQALYYGKRYAKHFGLDAELVLSAKEPYIVGFVTPAIPTQPPADGIGPRPVENNGV